MSLERWAKSKSTTWGKRFYEQRRESEGHPHEEAFIHDSRTSYIQMVLTGFLRNCFYMDKNEILNEGSKMHSEMAQSDPEFQLQVLMFARKAQIKDQVLMGLAARGVLPIEQRREDVVLSTFPPHLVARYATLMRKKIFGKGLGSYEKAMIRSYLYSMEDDRQEYCATRYLAPMRDLINLSHPKGDVYGWVVAHPSRRKGPTLRLKAYDRVVRSLNRGNIKDALHFMADYMLPFELLRAGFKKGSDFSKVDMKRTLRKVLTPNATVLNAKWLIDVVGDANAAKLVLDHAEGKYVSAFSVAKAYMALDPDYAYTRDALDEVFTRMRDKIRKEIDLPALKTPNATVIVDASGSMFSRTMGGKCGFIKNVLSIIPIFPNFKRYIAFSEEAKEFPEMRVKKLRQVEAVHDKLMELFGESTHLSEALEMAKDDKLVFVFSDEQENVGPQANSITMKGKVVAVNPSPYPAHALPAEGNCLYLPAATPESLVAALRLMAMHEQNSMKFISKLPDTGNREDEESEEEETGDLEN